MGLFCPYTRSMTIIQGAVLLPCSAFHIFTKQSYTETEGSGNIFCLRIEKHDRFLRVWEVYLIYCLSLCNLLQPLQRQFGNNYQNLKYTYPKTHNSTLQWSSYSYAGMSTKLCAYKHILNNVVCLTCSSLVAWLNKSCVCSQNGVVGSYVNRKSQVYMLNTTRYNG